MRTNRKNSQSRHPKSGYLPHRPHQLLRLPTQPSSEEPSSVSPEAERIESLVRFVALQGFHVDEIIPMAEHAFDHFTARYPEVEDAGRGIAELLCREGDQEPFVVVSKDLRIWTSVVDDPTRIGEVEAAVAAGAPPKPLPPSLRWPLAWDDGGLDMYLAARCLLEAFEYWLEYYMPGEGRVFLDSVHEYLVGESGDQDGPDIQWLGTK